jgi:murein DD-endopeptidase MepM/ murein hydrolase activator NlpD
MKTMNVLQRKGFWLMVFITIVTHTVTAAQNGNGLFIWPTSGRVSSEYGYRRSPINGKMLFHNGIDIAAPRGTPVVAALSGQVGFVGRDNVYGNYAVLNHESGYRTLYAHLHVVRVKVGDSVETGQHIGDVGSTGLSTGAHLHFAVNQNDVLLNPRTLLR